MKKNQTIVLCIGLFMVCSSMARSQSNNERLGLPGDNLNLAAVLDIFQRSPTLEKFESALNADTSKVNNLDLNNDNRVDYIKVYDKTEGDLHTIILQVDVSDQESQDVAVIFVEKKGNDVTIQMVGDEDLYGKNYVLEPSTDNSRRPVQTRNPGYQGEQTVINNYYYNTNNSYYESVPEYAPAPANWGIIRFMYGPMYRPWFSPWRWGYFPGWYRPWTPWYWDTYYNHWYYNHPWNGWWYWRAPDFYYTDYWYGPYRLNRRSSASFYRNRESGVFNRTYNNPRPEPRPSTRPRFANHNVSLDKNPAVVRPDMRPDRRPTEPVKDARPDRRTTVPVKDVRPDRRQNEPTKDVRPDRRQNEPTKDVRPDRRQNEPTKDVRPDRRQTEPAKDVRPSRRPSEPVKDKRTAPGTPGPKREIKQETRPSSAPARDVRKEAEPVKPSRTGVRQETKPAPSYNNTRPVEKRPSTPANEQRSPSTRPTPPVRNQDVRPSAPVKEQRRTESVPSRQPSVRPANPRPAATPSGASAPAQNGRQGNESR